MSWNVPFHKAVASGNDFVLIDNRKKKVRLAGEEIRRICAFHLGIGADGILLIEPSGKADFFMRILNADASEAEACGNGYRCVSLYAHKILKFPKKMKFETLSGMIHAEVKSAKSTRARVRVKMADPVDYRDSLKLLLGSEGSVSGAFMNTGVPHAVLFSEDLSRVDVERLGRQIRHHKFFAPKGTNANFVQVTGAHELAIRTFERGVEGETLACGTGSVAAAVVAFLAGRIQKPVQVKTKSGEVLSVDFESSGKTIQNVFLEGDAELVFEGKLL